MVSQNATSNIHLPIPEKEKSIIEKYRWNVSLLRDLVVLSKYFHKSNITDEIRRIKRNKIKLLVPEIEEKTTRIERDETINTIVKVNIDELKSCIAKLKS